MIYFIKLFLFLQFFICTISFAQTGRKVVKYYKDLDYFTLKGKNQLKKSISKSYPYVKLTWVNGDTMQLPAIIDVYFKTYFSGKMKKRWYISSNSKAIISIRLSGGEWYKGLYYTDSTYHTPNKVICVKSRKENPNAEKTLHIVERIDNDDYQITAYDIDSEYFFSNIDINKLPTNYQGKVLTNVKYYIKDGQAYIEGFNGFFPKKVNKKVPTPLFWVLHLDQFYIANN
jgi:hypothetical protein